MAGHRSHGRERTEKGWRRISVEWTKHEWHTGPHNDSMLDSWKRPMTSDYAGCNSASFQAWKQPITNEYTCCNSALERIRFHASKQPITSRSENAGRDSALERIRSHASKQLITVPLSAQCSTGVHSRAFGVLVSTATLSNELPIYTRVVTSFTMCKYRLKILFNNYYSSTWRLVF